jgi:hypothetical protein
MNVTQKNFEAFYEEFKKYLPEVKHNSLFILKADFVSMDLEMTGIENSPSFYTDLPFEKYQKVRKQ